jgi:hypothetical protein
MEISAVGAIVDVTALSNLLRPSHSVGEGDDNDEGDPRRILRNRFSILPKRGVVRVLTWANVHLCSGGCLTRNALLIQLEVGLSGQWRSVVDLICCA